MADQIRIIDTVERDGSIAVVWMIGRRADDQVLKMAQARLIDVGEPELHAMLGIC